MATSQASPSEDLLMPTEEVAIGRVHHVGGQLRAAVRIDELLVLVAKSRGEGFYLARDPRLASSFTPDPILAQEIRRVRPRRRRR